MEEIFRVFWSVNKGIGRTKAAFPFEIKSALKVRGYWKLWNFLNTSGY